MITRQMLSKFASYLMSPSKWKKSVVSPEFKSNDIFGELSESDEEGNFRSDQHVGIADNESMDGSFIDNNLYDIRCKKIDKSIEREKLRRRKELEREIQEKVVKKSVEIMEKSVVKMKDKSNNKVSKLGFLFGDSGESSRRSTGSESRSSNADDVDGGVDKTEENGMVDLSQPCSPSTPQSVSRSFFSMGTITNKVATIPVDSAIFIATRYYQEELQEGYAKIDEELQRECKSRKILIRRELKKAGQDWKQVLGNVEDGGEVDAEKNITKERKLSVATAETALTITEKLSEVRLPNISCSDNNEGLNLEELGKEAVATQLTLEQELDKIQVAQGEIHAKSKVKRKVSFSDEVEQGLLKREEIAALIHEKAFSSELSSDDDDDDDGNDDNNHDSKHDNEEKNCAVVGNDDIKHDDEEEPMNKDVESGTGMSSS